MKACLIYPREINLNFLPLGLGYLGAMLEQDGHEVFIFDVTKQQVAFIDTLKEVRPDLIGISISSPQIRLAEYFISEIRKNFPSTPIVCGGSHPSYFRERLMYELDIDFVIFGEGELTIIELCRSLEGDKNFRDIKGLAYRKDSQVFCNEPRDIIKDLDAIPFPLRNKFNMDRYLKPPGLIRGVWRDRTANLISGRGCIGRCIFCASHSVFGRKGRRRSVNNVIREIEGLVDNYKIDSLWFVDDNFLINEQWVLDFCQKMQAKRFNFKWACQGRVDTVTEKMLISAREAGCIQAEFGVETCSPRLTEIIKKGIDSVKLQNAFGWARKAGIRTLATFVIGFPQENITDIEQTLEKARLLRPDFSLCFYATPYPGSELYDKALGNNWLKDNNFSKWFLRNDPVLRTGIPVDKLREYRHRFGRTFRWRNAFFFIKKPMFLIRLFVLMTRRPLIFIKALKEATGGKCLDDIVYYFLASTARDSGYR